MKKFFQTWIDWWLFVPISLTLAVGSYWWIPMLIGKGGLLQHTTGTFVPEQQMQFTGTAWLYSFFIVILLFMLGTGLVSLVIRWYYREQHKYQESEEFDKQFSDQPTQYKMNYLFRLFAVLFIGFCLLCIAVF